MKYNRQIHHRRSIRLRDYDYSQAGAYFVTICVWNKECLFGDVSEGGMKVNEAGDTVMSAWEDLPNRYGSIALDEFVIMPNHVHGIIVLHSGDVGAIHELPLQIDNRTHRRQMLLPTIIGRLKMNAAKRINIIAKSITVVLSA